MFLRPREAHRDSVLDSLVSERKLQVFDIPTLDELLEPAVKPRPWTADYSQDLTDPFVILHSSGSTGPPRAVNVTHGLYATLDFHQHLATSGQRLNVREWAGRELFITLPPFHAAGLNFFGWSVFHGTVLLLGPADTLPSANTIERALDLKLADACVTAPSILEEFVRDQRALSKISHWSSVSFGGGPLSQAAGDALWEKTRVHPVLGSTETNTLPEFVPASKDEWQYHNFHPSLGMEFRHRQGNLYELVIVRHSRWRTDQAIFWTFPQLDEYAMKDLYEQHPSKPNLWAYRGRTDDIIVLSNGEKFSPIKAESIIVEHPDVKSAIMLGTNHAQSALLIELFDANLHKANFERCRSSIESRVQKANKILPHHAQIHTSHIKIMSSSQGFLRSPKGEVRRAPTVELLKSEIEDLYTSADAAATSDDQGSGLDFTDASTLESCLTTLLSHELYLGRRIDADTNIFQCGFDSLRVTRMLRYIKTSLANQGLHSTLPLNSKTIYQNPSPLGLAIALLRLIHRNSENDTSVGNDNEMNRLLTLFSDKIGTMACPTTKRQVVVLTGSTGSLGSYVLDRLVRSASVKQVICLNRAGSGASRQATVHEKRGLITDFSKVLFFEADLEKDHLGLGESAYRDLALKITHIVHNAWPVDFNLSLSSFEPQLTGCLHLLKLATEALHLDDLSFVSSIGVASGWTKKYSNEVPEAKIGDLDVAENMGYAQSKLLSELIFAHGCETLDVPVSICRVGQITGPVMSQKGMWSPREWFPSIIQTCKHLGVVPADLGALNCMDWIPVDVLADAFTEALLSNAPPAGIKKTRYMHFVNPQKSFWSDMAHTISSKMDTNRHLKVVPFCDWLKSLAAASERSIEIDSIPAIKLLDFLREMADSPVRNPSFATKNTQAVSPTLDRLAPVSIQWVEQWLDQWSEC